MLQSQAGTRFVITAQQTKPVVEDLSGYSAVWGSALVTITKGDT